MFVDEQRDVDAELVGITSSVGITSRQRLPDRHEVRVVISIGRRWAHLVGDAFAGCFAVRFF